MPIQCQWCRKDIPRQSESVSFRNSKEFLLILLSRYVIMDSLKYTKVCFRCCNRDSLVGKYMTLTSQEEVSQCPGVQIVLTGQVVGCEPAPPTWGLQCV